MIKYTSLWVSLMLLAAGCTKQENKSGNFTDVTSQVNRLYESYGKSGENLYDKPLPKALFSDSLRMLLQKAVKTSQEDMVRIKNSTYPDDKPMLLEGSVFTSLYEGYTSYRITKITMQDSSETKAKAAVEFENTWVVPKTVWTDHILLLNDHHTGWKIDNIIFGDNPDLKDLKTGLQGFTANSRTPQPQAISE